MLRLSASAKYAQFINYCVNIKRHSASKLLCELLHIIIFQFHEFSYADELQHYYMYVLLCMLCDCLSIYRLYLPFLLFHAHVNYY